MPFDPTPRFPAGTELSGRYVLGALLGRGGMGEVYAAFDAILERPVAIKVLREHRSARPHAAFRLHREACAGARIDDPASVRVFDYGVDDGVAYVVLEALRGQTVSDLLATWGRLAPSFAVEIALQVARALAASHAAGVVHRDVKPGNLFCLANAQHTAQIKLLDFGLARMLTSASGVTRTCEQFGTLPYVAPEQLRSARRAGPKADLYALGCVLFEMVAGRPPFQHVARRSLRTAILAEEAPDLTLFAAGLDDALCGLVRQLLSKVPDERPDALEVARALSRLPAGGLPVAASPAPPGAQRGYAVVKLLGAGSHGRVYAAESPGQSRPVALKRVDTADLAGVARLKRELEALSALSHPNIVRAEELWIEADHAVLAMELVEGVALDRAVFGTLSALRAAFFQIADAVASVHAAGLVHCDLKPDNILVESGGRVVLLDFGACARITERPLRARTPRYAAPESGRQEAGAGLDLYAIGAMLQACLAHSLTAGVPSALDDAGQAALMAAAQSLTDALPERRPSAAALRDILGAEGTVSRAPRSDPGRDAFVGRSAELRVLGVALRETRAGRFAHVDVTGPSGIGKTCFVEHFLAAQSGGAWLLPGRCRATAGWPFPGIDGTIDALCGRLVGLPKHKVEPLLPADAALLPALFPAFLQVDALRALQPLRSLPSDPRETRGLATEALRELLRRCAEGRPIVLWLDDAHFLDPDSAALLRRVLRPPAPPLLLVTSSRPTHELRTDAYRAFANGSIGSARELVLGPLSAAECRRLALELWPSSDAATAGQLYERTAGHPLFLGLLLQSDAADWDAASLPQAVSARIAALRPEARRLLALCCACPEPVEAAILRQLADVDDSATHELERARLVREVPLRGGVGLAPYHDLVPPAVAQLFDDAAWAGLCQRLAEGLPSAAYAEAQVALFARVGRRVEARAAARAAAEHAERTLAFERAATLFERAAELSDDAERDESVRLRTRAAYAFRCAGRTGSAADAYLRAARDVDVLGARALERKAFEQCMLGGEVARGLTLLTGSAWGAHITLPATLDQTLMQAMMELVALRQRGLGYVARPRADIPEESCEQVEVYLTLAHGLSHVDLRGLPFAFLALRAALDAGEVALIQRAAAVFVWNVGTHFTNELVTPVLELARELTPRVDTPLARALLAAADAEDLHRLGRFLESEAASLRAERILTTECKDATRELDGVRANQAFLEYAHKGDFQSRVDETLAWLSDAEARGDVYQENMLRVAHALVWVGRDQPERARGELTRAEAHWPSGVSVFELSVVLFLDVLDRYERVKPARELRAAQGRAGVLASSAASVPFVRGYLSLHRGYAALRLMAENGREPAFRADARREIETLRSLGMPLWRAVADGLEANLLLAASEARAADARLEQSEYGFRALHMPCLAACAKWRRGEIDTSVVGGRIFTQATNELRALGVVDPERFARAYFAPFPVSALAELTLAD